MSKISDFNLTKLSFLKPTKVKNMYLSKLLYDDDEINIQLKRKITPSGVYREGNKYFIDLIFDIDNSKDKKFITLYKQLEMSSIKQIYSKYNEWMGIEEKLEWEDVYTSFKSQLVEENDINKIKFHLLTSGNLMNTSFYNEELKKISHKEVEEGDEISVVICFTGIKFGKQKFENQWEILQVKRYNKDITEEIEKVNKCQINIDSDDDNSEEYDNSINIEDYNILDKMIEEKYKQYNEEEFLKFID